MNEPKKDNKGIFDLITECIGWIEIVASPTLIGLVLSLITYLFLPNTIGIALAISLSILGFIIGVIWATKVWRRQGTIYFLSRNNNSKETEKVQEE